MQCTRCGWELNNEDIFCTRCGFLMALPGAPVCPRCGNQVHTGDKFCRKCGCGLLQSASPGVGESLTSSVNEKRDLVPSSELTDEIVYRVPGLEYYVNVINYSIGEMIVYQNKVAFCSNKSSTNIMGRHSLEMPYSHIRAVQYNRFKNQLPGFVIVMQNGSMHRFFLPLTGGKEETIITLIEKIMDLIKS